ncbi:MAG: hypothetical protein ACREJ0_30500, partial [Geminicoccaceae bacterium]
PSWPSGHSLESHMVALALKEVLPDERNMHAALEGMADRIGKNREIAGVHYASDTDAGKRIASKAFPYLRECPTFERALEAARAEF